MDWHQRSLASMTLSDGTAVSFQYNADGIRTKKTVGTAVHNYVLDGSTILKETITTGSSTTTLYYYYDESGVSGLEYNGTKYTYVKNLQGDVIGIINANGVTVVEYKYDAWGNILSVTGSLASTLGATNPFRYRGYYYDTESGWYYLNSRYYDPQVGRFINADGIIGANGGIVGYNMFAYCNNNPVMYEDENGFISRHLYGGPRFSVANRCNDAPAFVRRYFDESELITNQGAYADSEWASSTIAKSGCAIIALHNAKEILGIDSTLDDTINDVEANITPLLDGRIGIAPFQISVMLDYYNISHYKADLSSMSKEGVYIITYWHDPWTNGAHTIAVYHDGFGSYKAYNQSGGTAGIREGHPSSYISFAGWNKLESLCGWFGRLGEIVKTLAKPTVFYLDGTS